MRLLLQLEWGKVRRYRTFWVFLVLFTVTLAGIAGVLYKIQRGMHAVTLGAPDLSLLSPERLWHTMAWASGFSILVLGLLVIVLVTNEFAFRTHRQEVMEGLPREAFMAAKWLVAAMLTLYAWGLYVLVTWVLGLASGLSAAEIAGGSTFAGYFLLKIALSLSVAMVFALWLKRAGLAIVIYLLYVLMLEGIVGFILNRVSEGLGDFLPLKAVGALISNPVARLLPGAGGLPVAAGWLVAVSLVYLGLFIGGSLAYFRRADL